MDNAGCIGLAVLIGGAVLGIALLAGYMKEKQRKARVAAIYAKYGHTDTAEKIIKHMFWVGQTGEELRDSLGPPADVDEKVLKTKRKEVWKYAHQGANRYGLRITLDNDTVVGWDEKL